MRSITAVNSFRLQAAVIFEYIDAARDEDGLPIKECQAVVRELATICTTLCFDIVPWAENAGDRGRGPSPRTRLAERRRLSGAAEAAKYVNYT